MEGQAEIYCLRCRGSGVLIEPGSAQATASLCECSRQCNICNGALFVFERDGLRREIARPCECQARSRRIELYNDAGVPGKYFDARLADHFKDRQNQEAFTTLKIMAEEYQSGHKGILLTGPAGVGKTFLVAAFIHEIIFKKGVQAIFRDFFHLLSDLRSGYGQGKPESELIEPLVGVELLVVDELGKGRNTPWEQHILDVIISHRYNNRNTTIFTSNYTNSKRTTLVEKIRGKDAHPRDDVESRDTLLDRIGIRIQSRLKEMCHFVDMRGKDRRDFGEEPGSG